MSHKFEMFAGIALPAPAAKNRLPVPAPPDAVTVTFGRSAGKSVAKVSAKNTRNGGNARRLLAEHAGQQNRLGSRLGPGDRLAAADQPGKIELVRRDHY